MTHNQNDIQRLIDLMHINEAAIKDSVCHDVLVNAANKVRKIARERNFQLSKPLIGEMVCNPETINN